MNIKRLLEKDRIIRIMIWGLSLAIGLIVFYIFKAINPFFISSDDKLFVVIMSFLTLLFALFRPRLNPIIHYCGEVLVLLAVPYVLFSKYEPYVNNMESYDTKATFYNCLLIFGILLFVYAITQNSGIAVLLGGGFVYVYYIADYYTLMFRGNPILFSDILSWRTAFAVAGGYKFVLSGAIMRGFFLLMLLASIGFFVNGKKKKARSRVVIASLGVVLCTFLFVYTFKSEMLHKKGFYTVQFIPTNSSKQNGLLLYNVLSTQSAFINAPEAYSKKRVDEIIEEHKYETEINTTDTKPNVILIMNESFSDLDYLENVQTTEETIPKFKAMNENCIKGTLISSILGGNTPNSEFECLTGCTMGFLPNGMVAYQQMISHEIPTLASMLKDAGYNTMAVHLYNPEFFDRKRIYPLLGIDDFYNTDNPPETNIEYFRELATDESSFNAIIDLYEKNSEKGPFFCFCVTIQNHGGYYFGTNDIVVNNANSVYANEYASILKITDDAFARFIGYYRNVDEPTIICMFGDHQPFLFDDFYDAIWDGYSISDEEKRYLQAKTPFVIWANYDIEEQDLGEISINYLGPQILKVAGIEMSDYYKYLDELKEYLPVISAVGFKDKDGNYFQDYENSVYKEMIEEYRILQYEYLKGNSKRTFFNAGRK